MSKNSRLVYSTDQGRIRETADPAAPASVSGPIKLERSSKGRGGKVVTVVSNLPVAGAELKALAKSLKQLCGTGGTIKNGCIEIQGEQRQLILDYLQQQGMSAKIAGG